jgi:hypothetical protein
MSNIVLAETPGLTAVETPEFSWRAVFAGAFVAAGVIFFLLFLGTGFGLSLVSVPEANANTAQKALTLGAIYFFAAQAFGLAVGGYLAGRLMGPVLETESEEIFHSSTHGLVVWAVAVLMTATMAVISGVSLTGSALNAAAIFGASPSNQQEPGLTPDATGYWVDTLFRPSAPAATPAASVPTATPGAPVATPEARAEAGRILRIGLLHGERLSAADHDQLARLVSQSTGADMAEASRRVDDVQTRIHQQEVAAAEAARRLTKYISLWLAASLCFGALVAAAAAMSGRWVDDNARSGL